MIKKLLPLVAAIAAVAVLFGPARQYLPGAPLLQSGGVLVAHNEPSATNARRATGIGLAPAAIVNPPATAARLRVTAQPLPETQRGYGLAVTVVAPDGKALVDAPVRFFELVELFGSREMLLGTGITDGRGNASYAYLPARAGAHQIVVRSQSQGRVTAGEGRLTFEASVAEGPLPAEHSSFAAFSDRVPYAAGVIVLVVWGLIGFALLSTARGVIGDARTTSHKGETA